MKILITNDDGVYSDGIWALAEELREVGKITVVAPDRDQSGTGTSVTLRQPLRLTRIESPLEDVDAYSVEGTPADSVIMAIRQAMKNDVDLVISGINEGPNIGNDVYISGTVGAALQSYFYGIPSIAISLSTFENLCFDVAAKLAKLLAIEIKQYSLTEKLLLNVNVPNMPWEKIEGIEITELGDRKYAAGIKQGHDGRRDYFWIIHGDSQWEMKHGSDIWALKQNRVSITPLFNNAGNSNHSFLKDIVANLSKQL